MHDYRIELFPQIKLYFFHRCLLVYFACLLDFLLYYFVLVFTSYTRITTFDRCVMNVYSYDQYVAQRLIYPTCNS